MLKELKKIFKSKDEKEKASAEEYFDDLIEKVDEDQQDLSQLERHIREEWVKIHEDMDEVKKEIDEAVDKKEA